MYLDAIFQLAGIRSRRYETLEILASGKYLMLCPHNVTDIWKQNCYTLTYLLTHSMVQDLL
jgi:hypothetical protein